MTYLPMAFLITPRFKHGDIGFAQILVVRELEKSNDHRGQPWILQDVASKSFDQAVLVGDPCHQHIVVGARVCVEHDLGGMDERLAGRVFRSGFFCIAGKVELDLIAEG